MDPTQSTGRRDSLLNEKKMQVDFRILENSSPRRTIFLWSCHLLFSVILSRGKPSKNKKTPMTLVWKKRSTKTRFLGPGVRLPIGKVPHMR